MKHALILTFLLFIFSGPNASGQAQEDDFFIGDFICDEPQEALNTGDDFTTILELPLAMITAFVHINRTDAGAGLDEGDGCALALVGLEDGDEIIIYKFRDISGEFASRYHFILRSEVDSDRLIALNTFSDVDSVAHELGYIEEDVRLYVLEQITPEEIASFYFFAGEPSANQMIDYVLAILNDRVVPQVRVDLSGEESTIVFREDLLEGDEEEEESLSPDPGQ